MNNDLISFYSGTNIDKIVAVFEGTFNNATDVLTRTGGISSFNYYRIAHGFPIPLFTELLWSTDNITYVDGGAGANASGQQSISYCDSTYIYIVAPSAVGTTYYKVICSWITDYDENDYFVDISLLGNKPLVFNSANNYQKIFQEGVLTFDNTGVGPSTQTVIHDLGYTPNAKVFVEDFSGEVWTVNFGGASNPYNIDVSQMEGNYYVDTTLLSASAFFVTGTKRMWYRIYYDS